MNETTTETVTTINTMNAADLHRILSDAKAFMSNDKTIPALCTVRIEAKAGNIIAVATDRFTLGVSRADYSGADFVANLSAANVDSLIRLAKTTKREANSRTVAITVVSDDRTTTLSFAFVSGESLSVTAEDISFPQWRQLFPTAPIETGAQATAKASFNPDFMARFAKVSHEREGMRLFNRDDKPAIVAIGDNFVGLIMQTRDDRTRYANPSWML